MIQNREDALLHFAGVLGAGNDHRAAREVDGDTGGGFRAIALGFGFKNRRKIERELGSVVRFSATQKQLVGKQRVPRILGDDAYRQRVVGVCAAEAIVDVSDACGQVGLHFLKQTGELRGSHGLIDAAPVDGGLGDRVAHDELVARRTAGKLAGPDHQRATGGELTLVRQERGFDEPLHR